MNKKFFTLIAGALVLAASLGTAQAQTEAGSAVTEIPAFPKAEGDGKLYQLSARLDPAGSSQQYVLTLDENGVLDLDTVGTITPPVQFRASYGETLWCLKFPAEQSEGQSPKVDFTNKSVGLNLAVNIDQVAEGPLDVKFGDLAGWGFSTTYKYNVEVDKPLYTYYNPDSVLVFGVIDGVVSGSKDSLVIIKAPADAIIGMGGPASGGLTWNSVDILLFTLWEPAPLILTAEQFNTILNTQTAKAVKLTFDKDKSNGQNPWSDQALVATTSPTTTSTGWLNFAKPKGSGVAADSTKFLRVDTAYINSTGSKFLAFKFDSIYKDGAPQTGIGDFQAQYDFLVRYDVANDSISIQVRNARFNLENSANWLASRPTGGESSGSGDPEIAGINPANPFVGADSLFVKLQDLVAEDGIRIITIGTRPAETHIKFGLACDATPPGINLTSVANNLYVIHNAAGQVLGVPIYTDSTNYAPQGAQWITYNKDNVKPNFIPAYQWVVKKTRNTNLDYSPITIINREFPNIRISSVQLYIDTKSDVYGADIDKDAFVPVPKEQKEDKYLGYFHISNEEAKLNSYDLNYLHQLSQEYFLGQSEDDSTMIVKKDQTEYKLLPQSNELAYGYTVNPTTDGIANLAQLVRVGYVLQTGGKYLTINENERYALTSNPYSYGGDSAAFLLKTNNTTGPDDKPIHYYALLDTLALAKYPATQPITYKKVGISDENLWAFAQVQKETRTSAFAINEYSAPLYRRFDGGSYTYGDGQKRTDEKFGASDNAPVWLKFTKQNNRNNQFLFENSPKGKGGPDGETNDYRQGLTNTEISFLGLYNSAQYQETDSFKYTFYVDTAYSARGTSASSTTVTPMPQYMLAVRPEFVEENWYVHQTNGEWLDSEGNVYQHDTPTSDTVFVPGFVRGYYVFNAQDSINVGNKDYEGKTEYGAKGATRLAFVDGVHMADTFYVLPGSYKTEYSTAKLQSEYKTALWGLAPSNKHYLDANTHYVPRYGSTRTPTLANNGKSMVFQFRLITKINESRAFLIETTRGSATENEIGPDRGQWVKIQNDVPVISNVVSFYEAANDPQNGSEIFNVAAGDEGKAVSNEAAPAVSAVKVVSEAGAVTILNAAGKKVAISNVLGQTVANAVLTSDNARVALPKGIVIVAVEGEAAIKAVVK